ncbi:MAG: ATP-binding protein [Bacteroidota bacterium]
MNRAHEKLKVLDDFKSQFFTNISHEFRTPLTVISGMVDQISAQPDRWLEKGSYLIKKNVGSLLGLINQILDLRKLEFGGLQLNLLQADIITFLRYGTESFESLAESRSLSLSFQSSVEQLHMDFDPEKLMQIQTNLLSNAIKFTPKGGQICVKVRVNPAGRLEFRVRDTGKGIPPEKLHRVFDQFYQVDKTDTRPGEGTGIGLSLSRELVRLMGGEIRAESELRKGATFTVELPITQDAPVEPLTSMSPEGAASLVTSMLPVTSNGPAPMPAGERPSLLVIEDNPDIVTYLYACLEDQYELYAAPDGQAGIETACEQVPDLIITDVMMPKKNGYEVCETLKLDERTSHIPIVMLTAKVDQGSKLEGFKRGADAFLPKPFDQQELEIRLKKLLELRKRLQDRYQAAHAPAPSNDPVVQAEDTFVQKVRELILANITHADYRGEALCQELGLSRTNLYRKIKALTGMPINRFIRSVRIERSKEFLQDINLQVAEVAYAVGFNDPGYFIRVFTEQEKITPGEWRVKQDLLVR